MSTPDIKDYLPFYLGQHIRYRYVDWEKDSWTPWLPMTIRDLEKVTDDFSISMFEIALRPLSDISENERIEVSKLVMDSEHPLWPKTIGMVAKYYLDKGFDIFGLIESGIALDKTKIKV